MRRVDHIGRDRQIVVEEFGAQRVVGDDAADLGRGQKHHLRALGGKPFVDRRLIAQVDLAAAARSAARRLPRASLRTSAEPTMPRWPAT